MSMLPLPPAMKPAPSLPPPPEANAVLGWMARRSVGPQWRSFLCGLLDVMAGDVPPETRLRMLRRAGARIAHDHPLPRAATLEDLEIQMNSRMAEMDWGYAALFLHLSARALLVQHCAAPSIPLDHDPHGEWIVPVLEGMHGTWLSAQRDPMVNLVPSREASAPGIVVLRFRSSE